MKIISLKIFYVIGIIFGFYTYYKIYIPIPILDKIHLNYDNPTFANSLLQILSFPFTFIFSNLLVLPEKNFFNLTVKKLFSMIVITVIVAALYIAPFYFNFRELANIVTIEANQGRSIELTKSLFLGLPVERFPEKSCAIFRWDECVVIAGCQYLEYSKDVNRTKSCYIKGAFRSETYSKEWSRYYWD